MYQEDIAMSTVRPLSVFLNGKMGPPSDKMRPTMTDGKTA